MNVLFEHSPFKDISDKERSLLMRIWQTGRPATKDMRCRAENAAGVHVRECLVLDESFVLVVSGAREVVLSLSPGGE